MNANTTARPAARVASLLVLSLIPIVLASCGGAKVEATTTEPTAAAETENAPPPETELHRAALDALLANGPAYVLALVQTESAKANGKFVGFTIVSFREAPPAYLDLLPGDVVTRVNGLPIETPDQFFAVFEALKAASEVKLDILRAGQPKTVTVPVVP